jgi:hypothetical protein
MELEGGAILPQGWHFPTVTNGMIREIAENIHRIVFVKGVCPACKVKR